MKKSKLKKRKPHYLARKSSPRFERVRLPRETEVHPLVIGLDLLMNGESGMSMRTIATKHFKITQQALFLWYAKAKRDRDWSVPPRQVPILCHLTKQAPYLYNPKLWPNPEWRL